MNYDDMTLSIDWSQTTPEKEIEKLYIRLMRIEDAATEAMIKQGEEMLARLEDMK